jgi:hypothetical protein
MNARLLKEGQWRGGDPDCGDPLWGRGFALNVRHFFLPRDSRIGLRELNANSASSKGMHCVLYLQIQAWLNRRHSLANH